MKAGGVSDMTKNVGVQVFFVGDDGGRAVGKRYGSLTMDSYLQKKRRRKKMGSYLVKGN